MFAPYRGRRRWSPKKVTEGPEISLKKKVRNGRGRRVTKVYQRRRVKRVKILYGLERGRTREGGYKDNGVESN